MTTDLNPDTNLPALPDGMFWRVRTKKVSSAHYRYFNHPQLELRQRRRLLPSKLLWQTYFYERADRFHDKWVRDNATTAIRVDEANRPGSANHDLVNVSAEQIQFHAEVVLKLYNESLQEEAYIASVTGDYPPKKLETP